MRGYTRYRSFRLLMPLILGAYLAVALMAPPSGFTETFPFFNWKLFASAPGAVVSRPEILVHAVDGETLETAVFFYALGDRFEAARRRDIRVSKTARQLARWHATGRSRSKRLRRVIEETFMSEAATVDYALVMVSYDPIERFRSGRIRGIRELASFSKGQD